MVICRDYNGEKRLDRVWYESSNILYSECDDNVNSLKTLRVTFKNGATYEYSDVDVNDYLMFLNGGLDGSNGKALNKFIKPKCKFERLNDKDPVTVLNEGRMLAEEKSKEKKKNQENTVANVEN
jgi:hypothetical protein